MKKVKVCHMTSVHNARDGRIFHKQCVSLAKAGYETYLVAPGESFTENGVTVIGVGEKPSSRIKRIFFFAKQVYKAARALDADIYHFHDPELLPYGLKLKKRGKKVIFDAHEHYEQTIAASPWIIPPLRKPAARYYIFKERRTIKKLDAVVCVTPTQYEPYKAAGVNVFMITNYPLIDKTHDKAAAPPTRARNRKICFAGGVKPEWMHENIINSLIECNAEYVIAGPCTSDYKDRLQSLEGWKNVRYLGQVPFEDVPGLMMDCSVGMAVLDYDGNTQGHIGTLGNTKLFEYMCNGLPIICTDFKIWEEIVNTEQCGICVNPHDINAIKEAIFNLLNYQEEADLMGSNGRRAIMERYNWATQEQELITMYEGLSGL